MRLSDFDYVLPEDLIGQEPLEDRSSSRLLHLDRVGGQVTHRHFRDIVTIFRPGDLIVLNDTRVTARRLIGQRQTGGKVEALILGEEPGGYLALTKPAKKCRNGDVLEFADGLTASVVETRGEGLRLLQFSSSQTQTAIYGAGSIPLPPYVIKQIEDEERYQTVYSRSPGSAAAPTAGLHFTHEVIEQLKQRGVSFATVTLDVGIDTFRPVTADNIQDHVIHGETCSVPEETARAVRECTGRIIAVGTTSVRTLETFALGKRQLDHGSRVSRLFVTPGFDLQIIDGMLTNFHLPKTSMLFMVSALAGKDALMRAYEEAVREKYRFLSFGDSMLIL